MSEAYLRDVVKDTEIEETLDQTSQTAQTRGAFRDVTYVVGVEDAFFPDELNSFHSRGRPPPLCHPREAMTTLFVALGVGSLGGE